MEKRIYVTHQPVVKHGYPKKIDYQNGQKTKEKNTGTK